MRGFGIGDFRPPISQAFAADAFAGEHSSLGIGDLSVIIPEIKLSEVSLLVGFAAVLIDTLHTALKHGEVALDGVGVC